MYPDNVVGYGRAMHTAPQGKVWDARLRQYVDEGTETRSEDMVWDGQKWVDPASGDPAGRSADGDANAALRTEDDARPEVEGEGRFNPADHTVDEVNAYLAEHPDDRRRVIASERRNKARSGVLNA